jgi:molybdenum cofactor cytidylyltransferase
MGRLKQLLPFDGRPVIRCCIETIISSGIKDIVVVLGAGREKIIRAIEDIVTKIVFNENKESEMAASVRIGLDAVEASSSAVLICLSDHPLLSVRTFKSLANLHLKVPDKIIIPTYRGKRGHPSLFPKDIISEIFSGLNLREIIARDAGRITFLDVPDEGVILDMDTMRDYEEIRQKIGTASHGKNS